MKKISLLLIVSAFCFVSFEVSGQPTVSEVGGVIENSIVWSDDIIRIIDNVTIADDVTLTINPGTWVVFTGHYYLNVQGTLIADGTETDTIVFTRHDTTGFSNYADTNGSWNGIIIDNGSTFGLNGAMDDNDTTIIDHCRIELVKIFSEVYGWAPIGITQFPKVVISHSEIRNNYTWNRGGGIYINTNSHIKVTDNHIHHNIAHKWAGGITIYNVSAIIRRNIIEHNKTLSLNPDQGKGGGIAIVGGNPLIKDNVIKYNSAIYGSGIFMLNCFSLITDNTIAYHTGYNNPPHARSTGGGIYMEQTSTPKIINNKITNNKSIEGGGIYVIESQPLIQNNLIANNTGMDQGGGLYFWDSEVAVINNTFCFNESPMGRAVENTNSEIEFVNNIAWGNGPEKGFHLQDEFSTMNVVNCIVQYGDAAFWGAGDYTKTDLSSTNPDFNELPVDNGSDYDGLDIDWSVTSASPAINAGKTALGNIKLPPKDLQGNDRIHHTFIDIGAYELHIEMIEAGDTIDVNRTWIADTVKIVDNLIVNDDIVLALLPGTYVEFQDTFHIKINGTLIAKGEKGNMIQFTMVDTIGWHKFNVPDGGWQGIIFDNSYDGMNNAMADNIKSVLQYCHFSFAKSPQKEWNGGAVRISYYDKVDISDCVFENNRSWNNGGAISLYKSDIDVERCQFIKNEAGAGGAISAMLSDMVINYCIFKENWCYNFGAAVLMQSAEAELVDNLFINNESMNEGGAIHFNQILAGISNNYFANNSAVNRGGAVAAYFENFQLANNVMVNNTSGLGGGVFMRYIDEAVTANNTICNNFANYGGGIYNSFSNHTAYNDILYGNDSYGHEQYFTYSANNQLNFTNCNLQGGPLMIHWFQGQKLNGHFAHLVDSLPEFINPSEGAGNQFDGTSANWNLKTISPCINSGTLADILQLVGTKDVANNPRVHDTLIDIGAFENQWDLPEIKVQPFNQVVCLNETAHIVCKSQYIALYQWQKDGVDIEGATGKELVIESIQPEDAGNYQCIVYNAFGSVASEKIYLGVESPPEILVQPVTTWGIEGTRTILHTEATGTPPLQFQWYKNGEILGLKKYPDLWINDTKPQSEAVFHCLISNACGEVSTDSVQVYLAPQICMVTVDSNENHNLVVWEKKSTAPVASYNIYRESIVQGLYDVIGNVPSEDLSVFTDTAVNPAAQSYLYKITAVDPDGNESDIELCRPHKTLHLLTSENPEYNQMQCDWDPYFGFPYGTFSIFRGTEKGVLDSIHSMSSSTNQWLDTEAEPGVNYYYRIVVRKEEPCAPTGNLKAGAGPYSHSLSNQDENRLQTTAVKDAASDPGLVIYPNPFSDQTTLRFPNPVHSEYILFVRDISGKVVFSKGKISGEEIILKRQNLKAGYYFVEIRGENIYRGNIVIE